MSTLNTEQEKVEAIAEFMRKRGTVIPPSLNAMKLFCMLFAVQLACRHPNFSGSPREHAEEVANELAATLIRDNPLLKQIWEEGWQQHFDA